MNGIEGEYYFLISNTARLAVLNFESKICDFLHQFISIILSSTYGSSSKYIKITKDKVILHRFHLNFGLRLFIKYSFLPFRNINQYIFLLQLNF